jgi:hypothetical protein
MKHDHNNSPQLGIAKAPRMHNVAKRRFEGMLFQIDDGLADVVGLSRTPH